jgi:hypothetical protein
MRFEIGFLERAYYANRMRKRASELAALAEERTTSATHAELLAEARWCEEQAQRLDDAAEPPMASEKTPIRIDEKEHPADYIVPKKENGATS